MKRALCLAGTLAGVESTQRWFAARGERYDDALVRVD